MPTTPQPEWLLAAAAIGGTIGGLFSLAGVQLQLRASRAESAAADRAKLRTAVRDLIAIDVAIHVETADMPPTTKVPKLIERLMPGGDLQRVGSRAWHRPTPNVGLRAKWRTWPQPRCAPGTPDQPESPTMPSASNGSTPFARPRPMVCAATLFTTSVREPGSRLRSSPSPSGLP